MDEVRESGSVVISEGLVKDMFFRSKEAKDRGFDSDYTRDMPIIIASHEELRERWRALSVENAQLRKEEEKKRKCPWGSSLRNKAEGTDPLVTVFKLSPFGDKTQIFDDRAALLAAIEEMLDEISEGEELTIEKSAMLKSKLEGLPDL